MIYTNLLCSLSAFAFLLVLDGGVVIILSLAGCQMALHSIYVSAERARYRTSSMLRISSLPMPWILRHGPPCSHLEPPSVD